MGITHFDGVDTSTGSGTSTVTTAIPDPPTLEALTPHNDCNTIFLCSELKFYYFDAASVLAPAPPAVIIPDDITHPAPGRWLPVPLPLPPGASGDVKAKKVPFTFASGSPLLLVSATAGDILIDAEIVIETPFDGVAPTLSVGDTGDAELFIPTTSNDPKIAGNYGSQTNKEYTGVDTVSLFVVSSGSTVGSGYVLVLYKDA